MEKGKNVVKRGRPFKTNANAEDVGVVTLCRVQEVGDATDDSWEDFIPITSARQYRKEMEEEAKIEEDDAGDSVKPKKRDDILYFQRTSKEFVDMYQS
ncbi:hypothetical protein SASPL_124717 [Salvia splendens]|uniref:Uncharacterized protein n=1 Tax=Salvia splendens TaxID=180675 RepID=A0A8X8XFT7_SALSN|nr:hypothetical protein SASPL_124717 [Salvia splendens]